MPDEQMNSSQLQAVMHGEGPMLVLAGPGSGKTTVIVNRILYLIQKRQISPEKILVVTFTKDAALSMQRRFLRETEEPCAVNFGTFHSIFYHILRQAAYFQSELQLFSNTQKKHILIGILKKFFADKAKYPDVDVVNEMAEALLGAIGLYKNTGEKESAVKVIPKELQDGFVYIFKEFQRSMRRQGGLDFDDMVYECRELFLKNKEVLEYWQQRFTYILVDEFQDINPLQYEVIKLLAQKHKNLFVVGDDDQAIYGFRGAKPACIRKFAEEFHAEKIILNLNYRSSAEIVRISNMVIQENEDRFEKTLQAARHKKKIEQDRSVRLLQFPDEEKETDWLKMRLKAFVETIQNTVTMETEEIQAENCAVLFRTNMQMQRIAFLLSKENIAYTMKGAVGNIYQHFIVRDVLAYLRFAKGERTRALFLQIRNRPVRYLDIETVGEMNPVDLEKLRMKYAGRGRPNDSICMQEIDMLMHQMEAMKYMSCGAAVRYLCKAVGYEEYLRRKAKSRQQWVEWQEILSFLKQESKEYREIEAWMENMESFEKTLQKVRQSDKEGREKGQQKSSIYLMTVHASKGLEFDRVIIPDCNEKIFPHGTMPDKETVEEERRIFYVGMTRAKKSLELCCLTGSKERPRIMSRFLNPVVKTYSFEREG